MSAMRSKHQFDDVIPFSRFKFKKSKIRFKRSSVADFRNSLAMLSGPTAFLFFSPLIVCFSYPMVNFSFKVLLIGVSNFFIKLKGKPWINKEVLLMATLKLYCIMIIKKLRNELTTLKRNNKLDYYKQ